MEAETTTATAITRAAVTVVVVEDADAATTTSLEVVADTTTRVTVAAVVVCAVVAGAPAHSREKSVHYLLESFFSSRLSHTLVQKIRNTKKTNRTEQNRDARALSWRSFLFTPYFPDRQIGFAIFGIQIDRVFVCVMTIQSDLLSLETKCIERIKEHVVTTCRS